MGNVTLPTPVALAGGAICILGGYLVGVVAGPATPERTTATVQSYDADSGELCLVGDAISDQEGVTEEGVLCGRWRRTQTSEGTPEAGEPFRFVSLVVDGSRQTESGEATPVTLIYGDVVR